MTASLILTTPCTGYPEASMLGVHHGRWKRVPAKECTMSTGMFETADGSRIPVHPQPGIFETTTAALDDWPEGNTTIITPAMIEEIIGQPAWDVREVRGRVDMARATERREGWGKPDAARSYHYFSPTKFRNGDTHSRALCRRWDEKTHMTLTGEVLVLHVDPLDLDPDAVLCKPCAAKKRIHDMDGLHE